MHINTKMDMTPAELRQSCRTGLFTGTTSGKALGFVQANLMILKEELADDFRLFCMENPKPLPILEISNIGCPVPLSSAPSADLRTDLPKYNIFKYGELVEEPVEIGHLWQDGLVCFLIGCSFTFERAMLIENIPVRHIEENKNISMYRTNIECIPSGSFSGPLVVTMRPIPADLVEKAERLSDKYPGAHGSPIHKGDPYFLGIEDLDKSDYGDSVSIYDDEIPVFWACGVTLLEAIKRSKPDFAITHAPGHMFVTDLEDNMLFSE
ncbi:putative hydro-lyase [candidate division KSB1 bacterium]